MKSKVIPKRGSDGGIKFVGVGKKTVDIQQIKERFEGLHIVTDWKRFDAMTQVRNDIEHYYTNVTPKALQSVVADAFIILRAFVATQLGADPRELLGEETWHVMLEVADIYNCRTRRVRRSVAGG